MRIAFFTALKEERAAVRQAWPTHDSGTLKGFPLDSGERAVCMVSGVGADRMTAAVQQALHVFRPDLAVLLGFSAGLRSDLRVGEVICDERGDASLVGALREFPIGLRFGKVAPSGFLHTAADKRALAGERAECLVADLESEAFMQAVGELPHLVIRAVSDDVDTTLPLQFDKFLTSRGFPSELAIARALARKPRLLPQMIRLAQASVLAQNALRDTLRDIRPLLVRRLLESR